jgi:hypothetical protein
MHVCICIYRYTHVCIYEYIYIYFMLKSPDQGKYINKYI